MKRTAIVRKTPLRSLDKKPCKPRMWSCAHCPQKNDPVKKKCSGCGIGRATKRKSLATRCDTIWALLVKTQGKACVPGYLGITCQPPLDAAHIVPRRHRSVRWDPANGRALCRAHHRYFTDHEKAWRDFIGPEWDRLWVKAQERWNGDYAQVLAGLRAAAKAEAA